MRRINLAVVIGIFVCFLLHAVMGSLKLAGATVNTMKNVGYAGVALIAVHVLLTLILTARTLKARRMSGVGYFRGNGLFWARRISGLAILIPLVMHLLIFGNGNTGACRLKVFTMGRLISQVLLVLTIALHAFLNMKPMLLGLGVRSHRAFRADLFVILSCMLLLFGAAFVWYYLRWMAY